MKTIALLGLLAWCTSSLAQSNNHQKEMVGPYVTSYEYDANSCLHVKIYKDGSLLINQNFGEGMLLHSIDTCRINNSAIPNFLLVTNDENTFFFNLLSLSPDLTKYSMHPLAETNGIDVRIPDFEEPSYQLYALIDSNNDGYKDKLCVHVLNKQGKIQCISGSKGTFCVDIN